MQLLFRTLVFVLRAIFWLRWFRHTTFPRHIELALTAPLVIVLMLLFVQLDHTTAWLAEVGQWVLVASMALGIVLVVPEAKFAHRQTRRTVSTNGKLH